jgi:hypothetical protein
VTLMRRERTPADVQEATPDGQVPGS